VQVIENNRRVIVGGRGFKDLGSLLGAGFDLDDETDPGNQVVLTKRPQVYGDVSQHPQFQSEIRGGGKIRGWIAVPMLYGNRVIGLITLDKYEPGFYNFELAELAMAFAAQAAIAIENARLFETERIARERAETLRVATQALGTTLSLRQVIELILIELQKVVPYDSCSVQQLDGDAMVIVGGHGFPNLDELLGTRFFWNDPDDPAGDVVRSRAPVMISNVSARFKHFKNETHGKGRVHGWMGVPLLFGERLIGMITLDKLEEGFYTSEHAKVALAFAAQAATAIENARLFDETQHLLKVEKQRAAETETLLAVTQTLSTSLGLKDVIEMILSQLEKVVPYDSCSVQQLEGDHLVIIGGRGFSNLPELIGVRFDPSQKDDPANEVVRTRAPYIVEDVSERYEHFRNRKHGHGRIHGWMGVPLLFEDRLIGMLALDKFEKGLPPLTRLALAFAAWQLRQ
jgi:GAF domain-containing protein